jgi:hypothetical protein
LSAVVCCCFLRSVVVWRGLFVFAIQTVSVGACCLLWFVDEQEEEECEEEESNHTEKENDQS